MKFWYINQKIGINTIQKFMNRISNLCCLSKKYTNHCVRSTCITEVSKEHQDTDVQVVSGHKSLNALGIYKKPTNERVQWL